jgi:2-methylcitrate dehydratase PrpD
MLTQPSEQKRRPATAIDAKFSLPFTVATALLNGTVTLEDFDTSRLQNAQILNLAARVHLEINEQQETTGSQVLAGSVTVHLRDGTRHTVANDEPYGSPNRPLTDTALLAKFTDCCLRARSEPSHSIVQRWAEQILSLDDNGDVGHFIGSLGSPIDA